MIDPFRGGGVTACFEGYPAPFVAASGFALDDASGGGCWNVTLTNNADWECYAANGSANNSGNCVEFAGTTVGSPRPTPR